MSFMPASSVILKSCTASIRPVDSAITLASISAAAFPLA